MASMTDLVSEGLKYPFNDTKKLLSLGALFALLNIITFGIFEMLIDLLTIVEETSPNSIAANSSTFASSDIYIIALFAIIGFIIALLIMGYQYDIIKFSIAKSNDLPGFGDVLSLLTKGLKYFIACFVYNIIPVIVFVAGIELLSVQNGDYYVSVLALILFIICNFLLIMALANMADTDKLTKAFDLKEIINKIANLGWVTYIGITLFTFIVYAIIMVAISVILMFITILVAIAINQAMVILAIIGTIQGLFISSYISVFFNRVYGSVYREAIK